MGTVGLKHVQNGSVEFVIIVRTSVMGYDYSKYGMEEILKMGFEDMNLQSIYWCVVPANKRAVRFYDKNGYKKTSSDRIVNGGTITIQQRANRMLLLVSGSSKIGKIYVIRPTHLSGIVRRIA